MNPSYQVDLVRSRRDHHDFLDVVAVVYAGDPHFVRLPRSEEIARITSKNPYFSHAKVALFVARDDKGRAVGRISAQIDELAQEQQLHGGLKGHFGFLEAVDEVVMGELLDVAQAWLKEQGAATVTGPFSFSINEETGLLIEGHDDPARVLMNYAPSWYGPALEKYGFTKAKDVLAFHFDCGLELPPQTKRMADKATSIPGLQHRILNKRHFAAEIRTIADIFNDAWSENWGYVPMTDEEVAHMAASLKPILPPDLVRIVEIEGQPAAMIVILPDVHEALAGLGGKLFPFGWAKLLWRLKIRGLTRARVVLVGISGVWKNDLRSAAIVALLMELSNRQLGEMGYTKLELSWILEDNMAMMGIIKGLGGELYKRYRVYEKKLA